MPQLLQDYLNSLETLFDDYKKTIDGLPQEALDSVPGTEMNSLCVIVVHVAGSTRYWIGDIVAKEDSNAEESHDKVSHQEPERWMPARQRCKSNSSHRQP